jgi:hypothetical protein
MKYFKRIIKHYITLALREAGVRIDGDVYAELDGAIDSLEDAIRDIVREEMAKANG